MRYHTVITRANPFPAVLILDEIEFLKRKILGKEIPKTIYPRKSSLVKKVIRPISFKGTYADARNWIFQWITLNAKNGDSITGVIVNFAWKNEVSILLKNENWLCSSPETNNEYIIIRDL